jgi:hypothetical protein
MHKKGIKITTLVTILLLIYSCIKTTTYLAPNEAEKISTAKKIIIAMADGTEFELKNAFLVDEKLIGYTKTKEKKEFALSAIKSVRIEKMNTGYVFLFGGVAVVAAWLIIGAATAPEPPPSECCPFIYSFDGHQYVFDAEPYGGAICQGLARTEWCELENLKEVNGQYKILIENQLNETQYTDELKLVVVDHPQGVKVAPDNLGCIHSISNPGSPLRALDKHGRNILPLIDKKDGKFWEAELEPNISAENLREELLLEFPKPSGVKKAKLWVNGCTTLWGSQVAREFLRLFGNELPKWYSDVNSLGTAYQQITSWYLREELYLLQIRVKEKDGWKSKGLIYGGGPMASEDKAYAFDVSDVTGDMLRIRLTPASQFWKIDYLALDYGDNLPLDVIEVNALEAVDCDGRDIRDLLSLRDHNYLVMPKIGDSAEVVFTAPAQEPGTKRSIFLKASGYYNIHLEPDGEPQRETISRIFNEPGFTAHFAYQEFLKWKNGNKKMIQ